LTVAASWAQAMQEIYLGDKTAKQALDEAAADIDRMVSEQLTKK